MGRIVVLLVLSVGVLGTFGQEKHCYRSSVATCNGKGNLQCNSILRGFKHIEKELHGYTNLNLAASYKYLLLGSYFNNYQKNRDGFTKLFRSLSDKVFDQAIDLIKHITKRGGSVNMNARLTDPNYMTRDAQKYEVDELQALAMLLDSEKHLAQYAHLIHERASTNGGNQGYYDPEVTQYLEEHFIEDQTERIRKASGYTNDLSKLMHVQDPTLSVFLFDQYLQKQ